MAMISLRNVFVIQIQIRLLCNGHAGMAQQLAQRVNIHAVHQASLGEVVPQTMGRKIVFQAGAD